MLVMCDSDFIMFVTRCRRAGYLLSGSNIAPHTEHLSSLISSLTSHTSRPKPDSALAHSPLAEESGAANTRAGHDPHCAPLSLLTHLIVPISPAHPARIAPTTCIRTNRLTHTGTHRRCTYLLHLLAHGQPLRRTYLELRSPTHGDFDPRNRLLRERADVIEVKQALRLLQAMNLGGSSLGLR